LGVVSSGGVGSIGHGLESFQVVGGLAAARLMVR
jgi:hypothetical protein